MSKIFTISLIVLLLNVTIIPSITANVTQDDLVEITSEFSGLAGHKTTVKLTQQEAAELEQVIDDIKVKLDNANTREETIVIFKEAVVELDEYGLLGDLSVEQAQRLVTGRYQDSRVMTLFQQLFKRSQSSDFECNLLSLIAGKTTETLIIPPISLALNRIFYTWAYLCILLLESLNLYLEEFYYFLVFVLLAASSVNYVIQSAFSLIPIALLNGISFGELYNMPGEGNVINPASGWIHTIGLLGIKSWKDRIFGQIFPFMCPFFGVTYIGIIGFTGFNIFNKKTGNTFYMGTAPFVKIGSQVPDW